MESLESAPSGSEGVVGDERGARPFNFYLSIHLFICLLRFGGIFKLRRFTESPPGWSGRWFKRRRRARFPLSIYLSVYINLFIYLLRFGGMFLLRRVGSPNHRLSQAGGGSAEKGGRGREEGLSRRQCRRLLEVKDQCCGSVFEGKMNPDPQHWRWLWTTRSWASVTETEIIKNL